MRSLATALSLSLASVGVMIASTTSAFAVPVGVPEPMTAVVFGAGLVGVAVIGRRLKK